MSETQQKANSQLENLIAEKVKSIATGGYTDLIESRLKGLNEMIGAAKELDPNCNVRTLSDAEIAELTAELKPFVTLHMGDEVKQMLADKLTVLGFNGLFEQGAAAPAQSPALA